KKLADNCSVCVANDLKRGGALGQSDGTRKGRKEAKGVERDDAKTLAESTRGPAESKTHFRNAKKLASSVSNEMSEGGGTRIQQGVKKNGGRKMRSQQRATYVHETGKEER